MSTASYRLDLNHETKSKLEKQPYSAFEYDDKDAQSLIVSVFPESRLRIDGQACRFDHFAQWWRNRWRDTAYDEPTPNPLTPSLASSSDRIFDEAFPRPFELQERMADWDRNEFVLWADELLFVITARGFIAGTLQLHMKLLDVRARTRAAVLDCLRPAYLLDC